MSQNFEKISRVLAASLGMTTEELIRAFARATPEELSATCELMRLGFGAVDNLHPDVIAWRYFNFSTNVSDIFVLRYQGKIIGAIGTEPIRVKVNDGVIEGIRAGDIVVHPEHMRRGIGAWMNLHLQHHFPIVMAMGANENSNTMVRRLFKPMNCRHHLKMLFSIKGYLEYRDWPPVLVKPVAGLSALVLQVMQSFFLQSLPFGYSVTTLDNTNNLAVFFNDSEFKARPLNIALRSAEYCRWRYDLNPKSQFKIFEMHNENRLIGYAVVKHGINGRQTAWQLMDWDLLSGFHDEHHLRLLFSAVARWIKNQGAISLSVMTSDAMSLDSLRKTGFSHRAQEDGFFLWAKPEVEALVLNEKNWFLSLCDTDEAL